MSSKESDEIIFMVTEKDGVPHLMLGIPEAAWTALKDGKLQSFDLTKIGLDIQVTVLGAQTQGAVMGRMIDSFQAKGTAV